MIRYLLPRDGQFYRANLHAHSTDSDGHFTPEELIEGYRAQGYSILALTEHNRFIDRSALCREDFLVLNAFEYNHAPYIREGRTIHLGLIARSPDITEMPDLLSFPNCPVGTTDETFTASINENIRRANEAGFLTVCNHMHWSMDTEQDVMAYRGLWGMEVFNFFSELLGVEEFNLPTFLAKLRQGERLFGIMADDNHNLVGERPARLGNLQPWDFSFGGYIQIKAPDLRYESIIGALERGDFYSSMGPSFHELYIEDGVLHVKCSPVRSISLSCNTRRHHNQWSREAKFTEAAFPLTDDMEFVVITLTDAEGRHAVSQAYWL